MSGTLRKRAHEKHQPRQRSAQPRARAARPRAGGLTRCALKAMCGGARLSVLTTSHKLRPGERRPRRPRKLLARGRAGETWGNRARLCVGWSRERRARTAMASMQVCECAGSVARTVEALARLGVLVCRRHGIHHVAMRREDHGKRSFLGREKRSHAIAASPWPKCVLGEVPLPTKIVATGKSSGRRTHT